MARLDAELVVRGLARSRERAKEMISSGNVRINGISAKKPSAEVTPEDEIEAVEQLPYVGRGALKIEKAAKEFSLNFAGMTCLDIGASTGGFTDYMLKNGAAKVFAVDVGSGQLARELLEDSRVVSMEKTDIRNVTADMTGGQADFVCADVSFISLKLILPKIYELLKSGGTAAVLVKPQFEAGKSNVGKRGIVKDRKIHQSVLAETEAFAAGIGLSPEGWTFSPVRGGSGNIEYLAKLVKDGKDPVRSDFRQLTELAFRTLKE